MRFDESINPSCRSGKQRDRTVSCLPTIEIQEKYQLPLKTNAKFVADISTSDVYHQSSYESELMLSASGSILISLKLKPGSLY